MQDSDLTAIFERMSNCRVLVIGDVMLDHYVWGDVTRISPEAPVPIVHVAKETYCGGGAANVALNLSALGVQTSLLSTWGTDESGMRLEQLLTEKGISFSHSLRESNVQTIVKKRVLARTQQLCRIDYEGIPSVYSRPTADVEAAINAALKQCDAVIVSDYAKGFITQASVDFLLTQADELGLRVAVDPKPFRKLSLRSCWLLTPNRQESLMLAGIANLEVGERFPIERVCEEIHSKFSPSVLIITLGADGMVISIPEKEIVHLPTEAREVFDVSGAGDTVIATLVAVCVAGGDCVTAARVANAAAGCVVAHLGTIPINPSELAERLSL